MNCVICTTSVNVNTDTNVCDICTKLCREVFTKGKR